MESGVGVETLFEGVSGYEGTYFAWGGQFGLKTVGWISRCLVLGLV